MASKTIIFGVLGGVSIFDMLSFISTLDEKPDLVLCYEDRFLDCEYRIKCLQESGLFNRVILLPDMWKWNKKCSDAKREAAVNGTCYKYVKASIMKLLFYGNSMLPVLLPRKFLKPQIGDLIWYEEAYTHMYHMGFGNAERAFFSYNKSRDTPLEIFFGGHAITQYYYSSQSSYFENMNTAKKWFLMFFKNFFLDYNENKLIITHPEYYVATTVSCQEVQSIRWNQRLTEFVNKLENYNIRLDKLAMYRYIYLDGGKLGEGAVIDTILECVAAEKFVLKKHPSLRSSCNQELTKCNLYFEESMFELLAMNMDISEKVIISNFSSAGFLPKILFDQEPYVIFTYKLLKNNNGMLSDETMKNEEKFVLNFISKYRHRNKICIPSNMAQFSSYLKNIESM